MTHSATPCAQRRTLSNVYSSPMRARHPSVPKTMGGTTCDGADTCDDPPLPPGPRDPLGESGPRRMVPRTIGRLAGEGTDERREHVAGTAPTTPAHEPPGRAAPIFVV